MVKERLTPLQALSLMYEKNGFELPQDTRATIGLIGHHYLLYDEQVNHRLLSASGKGRVPYRHAGNG